MKVSWKARSGRHKRHPVPHGDHRQRPTYSRRARILKGNVREASAPRVEDWPLGLSERAVASHLRPHGDVLVVSVNRAAAALTAPPQTHQEVPR
jgi:hypothetical protein